MTDGPYLLLGLLACLFDLIGGANYIRDVFAGRTRPHSYTWLVWCVLMIIGAAVAVDRGAWASAVALAAGILVNGTICVLGFRQGQQFASRGDRLALIGALSAIPIWLLSSDALWAAAIVSLINIVGCYPTYRKAWHRPFEENLRSFSIYIISSLLRIASVSPVTLTTMLYPVTIAIGGGALVVLIIVRRAIARPLPAA